MRFVAVIALLALLPSCKTAEELAAETSAQRDAQCKSYGATPGSDAYVNCRVGLEQKAAMDAQAEAQRSQAMLAGLAIMNGAVAPRPVVNPVTTCNTNYFAGMAHTTCY